MPPSRKIARAVWSAPVAHAVPRRRIWPPRVSILRRRAPFCRTDDESELAAALVLARRRRIGPFRSGDAPDLAGQRRELAVLARAGFPQDVARRALAMAADMPKPW